MYPNAVSNVPVPGSWGPPDKIVLFDDFVTPNAGVGTGTSQWKLVAGTVAQPSEYGGAITLVTAAAAEGILRQNGAPFAIKADKRIYFETRIRPADADDAAILFGLMTPADDSPIAGIADMIGFEKAVDVTTLNTKVVVATAAVSTNTGVVAADAVWLRLACLIEGTQRATFWVNGVKVGSTTTLPADGTAVHLVYALSLDAGAADAVDIDYAFCVQDR